MNRNRGDRVIADVMNLNQERFMLRSYFALSVLLLAPNLPAADTSISTDSESAWICIQNVSGPSSNQNIYHLRVTGNTDPRFLRLTASPLYRFKSAQFQLRSYKDADLKYRTNDFLVLKIDKRKVVFAVARDFPNSLAISLAKVIRAHGFHVETVEPDMLLHRNEQPSPTTPEFVVPYAGRVPLP